MRDYAVIGVARRVHSVHAYPARAEKIFLGVICIGNV